MKEKLKKLPIESWMGVIWLILALISYEQGGLNLLYHVNTILGFLALFTSTILMRLNKIEAQIKENK